MPLFILGSIAYDTIITPFVRRERVLGGSATYASLAASFFTNNVHIISAVGFDFPDSLLNVFKERNISLKYLKKIENKSTFYWAGKYFPDMNSRETIIVETGIFDEMDVPEIINEKPKILVLGNISPVLQKRTIQSFKQQPELIIFDTINFWIKNNNKELKEVIEMVDMVCINDEEARLWANDYSLKRAARSFFIGNVKYVVIKKGEHGAIIFFKDGEAVFIPALPLEEVKDPTGAGDVFIGAAAGFLNNSLEISRDSIIKALIYGSVIASFCVEEIGIGGLLNVTKEKISERIELFKKLSSVIIKI